MKYLCLVYPKSEDYALRHSIVTLLRPLKYHTEDEDNGKKIRIILSTLRSSKVKLFCFPSFSCRPWSINRRVFCVECDDLNETKWKMKTYSP